MLGIISESAPFTANISKIASRLKIGRNTVKEYLHTLAKSGILNFVNQKGKGISTLQKPDKIYLGNTNYAFALKEKPDKGNIRETFALNQLKNAGYQVHLPSYGDFIIETPAEAEPDFLIEVGGRNKTHKQLSFEKNGYVFADDIEIGFQHKIPLHLLGFLY